MAPRSPIRPGIPLTLADLQEARAALAPAILQTPLWVNDALSRELGASIHLKLENLQRTGSFKLRGATYKLDRLLAAGRGRSGLIAASAGNHAQGVARAAMMAGVPATVVMPVGASLTKIESCRSLGAEVILSGLSLEEARLEAQRIAAERTLEFIHPYDDWEIIAGQASVGLEIIEAMPDVSLLVVPLGGGGLLAGIALAVKLQRPDVRVVGVQSEAVAPFRHFLKDGRIDAVAAEAHTIADGIKVKIPGVLTQRVIAAYVDEIITVDDNAIAEAIVTLLERTRTIGEGAGVVGLAALMKRLIVPHTGDKVAVVISGGNADMTLVGRSIDFGLASSGRLMSVAVTLPDTPGRLAQLLGIVAAHGMNVRHVEHRRGELHVPVGFTEVILQIETRDPSHQQELLLHFAEQGVLARNLLAPLA
jgi:threonine dehydratase